MFDGIQKQAENAVRELLEVSKLRPGDLLVIGCSSSEIMGERIGKGSSMEAAQAVYDGIAPVLEQQGILLAVQCCEHLNRALIVEMSTAEKFGYEPVNVCPLGPCGRLLCHNGLGAYGAPGGSGTRPGAGGHGHRRHADRHASARSRGPGEIEHQENRRGQPGLCQDPAEVHRRGTGPLCGRAEITGKSGGLANRPPDL